MSRHRPIEPLTDGELSALLRAPSRRAPTGVRNCALIAVLGHAGLRLGEALALRADDVDLEHGAVSVHAGKGDEARVVGMRAVADEPLIRWLDVRARLVEVDERSPLFCTLAGQPLRQDYVRHMLPRLARRAGITKRCHAHGLRHSMAVQLDRQPEIGVRTIQVQLGHKRLATTVLYLQRISASELIAAMRNAA